MRLIHDDNRNIIASLPDKSIDLIVTDPPYEHVTGGMSSKRFNTGTFRADSYTNTKMSQFKRDDIFVFLDSVLPKMRRANLFIFCSKLQLAHYFAYLDQHKKLKYDLLIWDKSSETGKYSMKNSKFFSQDIEYVVRIYESGVSLNKIYDESGEHANSTLYMKRQHFQKPKGGHETMKPVALLSQYIQLASQVGDTVLDPFMGSGSTGVACTMTDRKFIGIELDETYFNLAQERIQHAINSR